MVRSDRLPHSATPRTGMFRKIDYTKLSSASSIIKGIKRGGKEFIPATLHDRGPQ
jgi:hypothetical protein